MNVEDIQAMIGDLGFPIVVTGYLLWRMDRLLTNLNGKLGELTDAVKGLPNHGK